MSNMLTRSGIIFLSMVIMLYIGGLGSIEGETAFISEFANFSTGNVELSDEFEGAAPNVDEESSGIGNVITGIIDTIRSIRDGIRFLISSIFSFPSLFTESGMPFYVQLAIGLPLVFIGVMALLSFVRSGN